MMHGTFANFENFIVSKKRNILTIGFMNIKTDYNSAVQ